MRVYLDELDLTADDVNAICDRLLRPDVRAKQRGSWDVIADLSGYAAEADRRNRAQREAGRRRAEAEQFEATRIAGSIFQTPE